MPRLLAFLVASTTILLACSTSESTPTPTDDAPGAPPTSKGKKRPPPGEFGSPSEEGDDPSCAKATYAATKAPLALTIMLDRSTSMLTATSTGTSKWKAATNALTAFMGSLPSDVSVGLSYFPQRPPGVPASCTTDAQCGVGGPCGISVCLQAGDPKVCTTSADCGGNPCIGVGQCSAVNESCLLDDIDPCGPGGGVCRAWCINDTSCKVADYKSPAVAIGPAPQTKAKIASSLATTEPWGDTPTAAALGGAMVTAENFALANVGFVPAAVLVTDGLPTSCGITDGPGIAEIAKMGLQNGTRTFVVGIFAPAEEAEARATLDVIAAGGGSGKSLIVKTNGNVASELAAALDDIRRRAVPCQFALPEPPDGATVDKSKVNVVVTPKGKSASTVPYVETAATCSNEAGWYYDGPKIILCPRSCDALASATDLKVDIVTGCQTVVR